VGVREGFSLVLSEGKGKGKRERHAGANKVRQQLPTTGGGGDTEEKRRRLAGFILKRERYRVSPPLGKMGSRDAKRSRWSIKPLNWRKKREKIALRQLIPKDPLPGRGTKRKGGFSACAPGKKEGNPVPGD